LRRRSAARFPLEKVRDMTMTGDKPVTLPRVAKGPRPQFFPDETSDILLSMNVALMTELMVVRERLDTLERVLEKHGVMQREEIEKFDVDDTVEMQREKVRQTIESHVFYLLLDQAERARQKIDPKQQQPDV
jgi:hypothetical protein